MKTNEYEDGESRSFEACFMVSTVLFLALRFFERGVG